MEILFRPIGPADVANLVRWSRDPEVARWWYSGENARDDAGLLAEWEKHALGSPKVGRYIIVADGVDVGEIQRHRNADFPAEDAEMGIPDSCGVDLFIGEAEYRHRGIGPSILRTFIRDFVFSDDGIETCVIDPEPENKIAIRAYEKVGFRWVRTFHSEVSGTNVYLMRLGRGDLVGG